MRPLTYACPKELLPVGAKPVIHRLVDELLEAGISRACVVSSAEKPSLQEYFRRQDLPLEVSFVYQKEPRGLGDALLYSREFAGGEDILVALGDSLVASREPDPPLRRLVRLYGESGGGWVLGEKVPRERISRYGVMDPAVEPAEDRTESFPLRRIVEKPPADQAPSDLAVSARYLLPNAIFDALRRVPYGKNGELALTDALSALISEGSRFYGMELREGEKRWDIGGFETYFDAFVEYAARDRDSWREPASA
jgi:UTP--glucose-1-phosphate uridylyltransferase